jgi:hypothetical protein
MKMSLYMVRVSLGASLYPDKTMHSHSRGRAERHARRLEREGFRTTLLVAPPAVRSGARKMPR